MSYKIIIEKTAMKFISKQPPKEKNRILKSINHLPGGDTIKMSGKYNLFRLRVGSYRIVYSIEDDKLIIRVIEAGNRGDVY
jgi:mRNA interferase RelE/StbE